MVIIHLSPVLAIMTLVLSIEKTINNAKILSLLYHDIAIEYVKIKGVCSDPRYTFFKRGMKQGF